MARVLLTALLAFSVCARELTHRDWDAATAGRPVFVKFFAPWCGHCKRMKPDWDQLMREYSGSQNLVVGDVDCTGAGQQLCQSFGVRGYPTIKYRAAGEQMLREYQGARDLGSLRQFVQSQQWLASTPQAPRQGQPQAPRQGQPQVPRQGQPQAPRQGQPQGAPQYYYVEDTPAAPEYYTVRLEQPEAQPAGRAAPRQGQPQAGLAEWSKKWATGGSLDQKFAGRREL